MNRDAGVAGRVEGPGMSRDAGVAGRAGEWRTVLAEERMARAGPGGA